MKRALAAMASLAAGSRVRLLPTLMVTMAALLSLKAVALAADVAEEIAADQPPAPATASEGPQAEPGQAAPEAPAQCPAPSFADAAGLSAEEVQVLQALGARRAALDARAGEMETQTALYTAAQQRLDERLAELRQLEATVAELLGQLDEQEEQRLAGLVDVYQRMRAKDAADVFNILENEVLVQVASRMRQQNLAEIMGRMTPDRARELTTLLAERNRLAGDAEGLLDRARGQPGAP